MCDSYVQTANLVFISAIIITFVQNILHIATLCRTFFPVSCFAFALKQSSMFLEHIGLITYFRKIKWKMTQEICQVQLAAPRESKGSSKHNPLNLSWCFTYFQSHISKTVIFALFHFVKISCFEVKSKNSAFLEIALT